MKRKSSCGCLSFGKKRKSYKKSHRTKRTKARKSMKKIKGILKRRFRFGSEAGPGYSGQTSFPNVSAPYFGYNEPFINPSEWWLPKADGMYQYNQGLTYSGSSTPVSTMQSM